METTQELQILLNALIRPGVEYNVQQVSYAGVSFFVNQNNKISALVPAPYFIIELEDIDITPQGEFYNYVMNTWQPCPYPVSIPKVIERMTSQVYSSKVTVPFVNLLNHFNKIDDKFKKKCRLIITLGNGEISNTDKIMKFTPENGNYVFRHKLLPKPCVVAANSTWPVVSIVPGSTYRCEIVEETADYYVVNVICPYSKVNMGIHYSEKGFFPIDMNEINRLEGMPAQYVMGVNAIWPQQGFSMPPIHLDLTLVYDLIRVFGIISPKFLEFNFGNTSDSPVLIRNVKDKPTDPQINILVGTLSQHYGAQRR